jgi:hypothetical protein
MLFSGITNHRGTENTEGRHTEKKKGKKLGRRNRTGNQ